MDPLHFLPILYSGHLFAHCAVPVHSGHRKATVGCPSVFCLSVFCTNVNVGAASLRFCSLFYLCFSTRRYASAVYAVIMSPSVCPSVCPSVTSQCCIETTGRMELVLGMEASSHLSDTEL